MRKRVGFRHVSPLSLSQLSHGFDDCDDRQLPCLAVVDGGGSDCTARSCALRAGLPLSVFRHGDGWSALRRWETRRRTTPGRVSTVGERISSVDCQPETVNGHRGRRCGKPPRSRGGGLSARIRAAPSDPARQGSPADRPWATAARAPWRCVVSECACRCDHRLWGSNLGGGATFAPSPNQRLPCICGKRWRSLRQSTSVALHGDVLSCRDRRDGRPTRPLPFDDGIGATARSSAPSCSRSLSATPRAIVGRSDRQQECPQWWRSHRTRTVRSCVVRRTCMLQGWMRGSRSRWTTTSW